MPANSGTIFLQIFCKEFRLGQCKNWTFLVFKKHLSLTRHRCRHLATLTSQVHVEDPGFLIDARAHALRLRVISSLKNVLNAMANGYDLAAQIPIPLLKVNLTPQSNTDTV